MAYLFQGKQQLLLLLCGMAYVFTKEEELSFHEAVSKTAGFDKWPSPANDHEGIWKKTESGNPVEEEKQDGEESHEEDASRSVERDLTFHEAVKKSANFKKWPVPSHDTEGIWEVESTGPPAEKEKEEEKEDDQWEKKLEDEDAPMLEHLERGKGKRTRKELEKNNRVKKVADPTKAYSEFKQAAGKHSIKSVNTRVKADNKQLGVLEARMTRKMGEITIDAKKRNNEEKGSALEKKKKAADKVVADLDALKSQVSKMKMGAAMPAVEENIGAIKKDVEKLETGKLSASKTQKLKKAITLRQEVLSHQLKEIKEIKETPVKSGKSDLEMEKPKKANIAKTTIKIKPPPLALAKAEAEAGAQKSLQQTPVKLAQTRPVRPALPWALAKSTTTKKVTKQPTKKTTKEVTKRASLQQTEATKATKTKAPKISVDKGMPKAKSTKRASLQQTEATKATKVKAPKISVDKANQGN